MPRRGGNHAVPAAERRRRVVRDETVSDIKARLVEEGIEYEGRPRKEDLIEIYATRGRVTEAQED